MIQVMRWYWYSATAQRGPRATGDLEETLTSARPASATGTVAVGVAAFWRYQLAVVTTYSWQRCEVLTTTTSKDRLVGEPG